jgi:hypothetical protein
MANLDSTTNVFRYAATTVKVIDGTGGTPLETTCYLKQGELTFSAPGRAYVETREAGRHLATPVTSETEDGNVTGSLTMTITSFKGSSSVHPYEVFTNNASYVTVGAGSKVQLKLEVTCTADDDSTTQVATFAYCVFTVESVSFPTDGTCQMTVNFVDHENAPTWA